MLFVADFDTEVIQRIVDPILEIDSTIDANPHLARLYLIPNGSARYLCGQDQLAVEWSKGTAVRWFRISGSPASGDPKDPKSHRG